MSAFRPNRAWFWVAIAAIAIVLVALLVPHVHGNSPGQPDWLALLPVFFVGLLVPFTLLSLPPVLSLGHKLRAPALAAKFQRPPPFCA
jgi:hypothetical protein